MKVKRLKKLWLTRKLRRLPYTLQRIQCQSEQFAGRNISLVNRLVESLDRLCRRLDTKMLIAPGPVAALLAARRGRFRRLPAWKVILLGDARDHLLRNKFFGFRFRREDRRFVQGC